MSASLHIQLTLDAAPAAVFDALTDTARLEAWFAEHADVSLPAERYDFWGRFTPEAPSCEEGRHPLLAAAPGLQLSYGWRLRGEDTTVTFDLLARDAQTKTIVVLRQWGGPPTQDISQYTFEDAWLLALENLRRHLDGRPPVRCDFSAITPGDITRSVEIDGPPAAVFDALIRPEQLERWIASNATVEPVAGGRYDLGWPAVGALRILEIAPGERLSLAWPEGERETIVTWTLEGSGGKTRLTLVHSGFAPDEPTGGLSAGWLNFMSWVKSLVEEGPSWSPPIVQLKPGSEGYYAGVIGARQGELIAV